MSRLTVAVFLSVVVAALFVPSASADGPGIWSSAGSMASARSYQTATLLPNGKVLVAGGGDASTALLSAELYDPPTNSFSSAGSMATARRVHTATMLPNGNVLVDGGYDGAAVLSSAELYTPAAPGPPHSVGGIAEQPDLTAPRSVAVSSGRRDTTYILGAVFALIAAAVAAASWRRSRAA